MPTTTAPSELLHIRAMHPSLKSPSSSSNTVNDLIDTIRSSSSSFAPRYPSSDFVNLEYTDHAHAEAMLYAIDRESDHTTGTAPNNLAEMMQIVHEVRVNLREANRNAAFSTPTSKSRSTNYL